MPNVFLPITTPTGVVTDGGVANAVTAVARITMHRTAIPNHVLEAKPFFIFSPFLIVDSSQWVINAVSPKGLERDPLQLEM
jgi:hypothetical protein